MVAVKRPTNDEETVRQISHDQCEVLKSEALVKRQKLKRTVGASLFNGSESKLWKQKDH